MGLGTKIKNALHADDRRSPVGTDSYHDGRLPGAFRSETEPTKQSKYTDGRDFAVQDPSTARTADVAGAEHNANGVNGQSTLHKSPRLHQKSDSGVELGDGPGFDKHRHGGGMRADDYEERPLSEVSFSSADDAPLEQPQPVKPAGLGRNKRQDPYWGDIDGRGGNRDVNSRGLSGWELDGRDLNDQGLDTGYRGFGLTGAGMARADGDDGRIRDRDMGRDRTGPHLAGATGIGASEAARRHHEADMKEAGYHSGATAGNGNYDHDGIGSGTGGRGAYGRSAGGTTPPQQAQQSNAKSGGWSQLAAQSPQQKQQSSLVTHYVPRVLHTCTNCGADNDISQYFKPDVAYRLSQ